MRRLLHVAMTRAREGLVLAYAARSRARARCSTRRRSLEEARGGARRRVGGARGGALRARRGAARDVPGAARRAAARDPAHRRAARRAAAGHRPRRRARRRALPRARSSSRRSCTAPRASRSPTRCPAQRRASCSAATAQQREILQTSSLDDVLLDAERDARARAAAIAARDEPSLEPFLPTRGDGLLLSASDIETYRTCPLKYKFARVFRIPQRADAQPALRDPRPPGARALPPERRARRSTSCSGCWRPAGGAAASAPADEERQLHGKADAALRRYHERFRAEDVRADVVREGLQASSIGAHTLRGRVDRVDRLPDGGYELIDYKTGRPQERRAAARGRAALALRGRRARGVGASSPRASPTSTSSTTRRSRCPTRTIDRDWITETVLEVADGILGQGFEPTPSYAACSICDYRIACPAAER